MFEFTPQEIEALGLSVKVSCWAVALQLPIALPIAWLLARREFPGKLLLNALVHLPLVLPPVVVGVILLWLLGPLGPVGRFLDQAFGLTFVFSWRGAALAAGVMSFPLMVRAIRLSFEMVDDRLEAVARTLGAGPITVFYTITLPLILPGIISGLVLAFARALGEFGATITFAANVPGETRTLPVAIYSALQSIDGDWAAMRLSLLAVVLSVAALILSELLSRRLHRRVNGSVSGNNNARYTVAGDA
jgi:molybdate transport system permease protein